jgi:secreted protein with Ig-like and vWFA domain
MDTLLKQKLEMWEGKLAKLKLAYQEVLTRRGEAMREGDLRENAAFQLADEDASAMGVQIGEVEKIIEKLQKEAGIDTTAKKADKKA